MTELNEWQQLDKEIAEKLGYETKILQTGLLYIRKQSESDSQNWHGEVWRSTSYRPYFGYDEVFEIIQKRRLSMVIEYEGNIWCVVY